MLGFLIQVFGVVSLLLCIARIAQFVYVHFVRAGVPLKTYGAGSGYWAAITGASDGIGKAYALEMAKQGFNIVLISRTESKLNDVAAQIESETQAKTKVVVIDFAHADDAAWKRVSKALSGLKLGALVNNAGLSHEMPEKFGEADAQRLRDIVAINIAAVNEMTRIALPLLLKNKAQGQRGLILNIGSASGLLPTPMLSVYAASKAYVADFSTALQREYRSSGVDVDCALPFFVVSKMSKRSRPSATIPLPSSYVKQSLKKLGHNDLPFAPFLTHGIMQFVIESVPSTLMSWVVDRNYVMHADIRRRAIAKAKRNASK